MTRTLRGYRDSAPSARQLAAYCGGCARDYAEVDAVVFRRTPRGRPAKGGARLFDLNTLGPLVSFVECGEHTQYPYVSVRYADGARRRGQVRFSGNLVDVVTEDEAIVASFRL